MNNQYWVSSELRGVGHPPNQGHGHSPRKSGEIQMKGRSILNRFFMFCYLAKQTCANFCVIGAVDRHPFLTEGPVFP